MFHTQTDNQLGEWNCIDNFSRMCQTNVYESFCCIWSDHKRERGNFWYDRGEYNMAIQLYRRSLEYLDDTDKYVGDNSKMEEVTHLFH